MGRRRRGWAFTVLFCALGTTAILPAHAAGLKIADLRVTNSEERLGVHAVMIGPMPPHMLEALETGIPATVRFTVELWQHGRYWWSRLLVSKVIERVVTFDVLTKEYRITAKGEDRPSLVTKTLAEAQRILTTLRETNVAPLDTLRSDELYYVRVRGAVQSAQDSALARFLPFVASGREESSWETSPLLRIRRGE